MSTPTSNPTPPNSWFSWGTFTGIATAAKQVLTSTTAHKEGIIHEANQTILDNLGEKQGLNFVKLSDLVQTIASKVAHDSLGDFGDYVSGASGTTKLFVAQAFANLSTQIQQEKEKNPKLSEENDFFLLISILTKAGSKSLNKDSLENIKIKHPEYQENLKKLAEIRKSFAPEELVDIDKNIEQYLNTPADVTSKRRYIESLMFTYPPKDNEELEVYNKNKEQYLALAEKLSPYNHEVKMLFKTAAHDILMAIFPEGHKDPAIQQFLGNESLYHTVFDQISGVIGNLLFQEYDSLEKTQPQTTEWKEVLETKIGADVKNFVALPTNLLGNVCQHLIHFEPAVVSGLTDALYEGLHPTPHKLVSTTSNTTTANLSPPLTEEQKKEKELERMSLCDLSSWMLQGVETLSNTKESELQGVLKYGQEWLTHLTESTLGKGITLLIENDEVIEEGKLLNTLSERIGENLKSLYNERMFLRGFADFLSDLPLPQTLKTALLGSLKNLEAAEAKLYEVNEIAQVLHQESKNTLNKYEGGDLLFAVIEDLAHTIVTESGGKKKLEAKKEQGEEASLVGETGLDETLQNLFDEFLPNQKMDKRLKEGLTLLKNFNEQGFSEESKKLLEKGIQTVIAQAIIQVIERDFDPTSNIKDQFIAKLQKAFQTRFSNLSTADKEKMREALKIQDEINANNEEIKALQLELKSAIRPAISEEADQAIDELLTLKTRMKNAELKIKGLKKQLKQIGTDLKINIKAEDLKSDPLIEGFSSDQLKLVAKAIEIRSTIKQAENEFKVRTDEYNQKKGLFDSKVESYPKVQSIEDANANITPQTWLDLKFKTDEEIEVLKLAVLDLEEKQSNFLPLFKEFAGDVTSIFGLKDKENLKAKINLPDTVFDAVFPFIENLEKGVLSKFLFDQVATSWEIIEDKEKNKSELLKNQQNEAIVKLIESGSKKAIKEIEELMSKEEGEKLFVDGLKNILPEVSANHQKELIHELQTMVQGDDSFLATNKNFITNYIEAIAYKFLVGIKNVENQAESNDVEGAFGKEKLSESKRENILETMTSVMEELAKKAAQSTTGGVLSEKTLSKNVEILMAQVLGISNPTDLAVPAILQPILYNKLKDILEAALIPILYPSIENDSLSEGLEALSGSPFLSNLAKGFSEDLFHHLPTYVQNYDIYAEELFTNLSNETKPTDSELKDFVNEINTLKNESKLTRTNLVKAFLKVSKKPIGIEESQFKKNNYQSLTTGKKKLLSIVATPSQIGALVKNKLEATEEVKNLVSKEVSILLKGKEIPFLAKAFIDNAVLHFFTGIAEKNLNVDGKDAFLILTEKLFDKVAAKANLLKEGVKSETIIEELKKEILGPIKQLQKLKIEIKAEKNKEEIENLQNQLNTLLSEDNLGFLTGINRLPSPADQIVTEQLLSLMETNLEKSLISLKEVLPTRNAEKDIIEGPLKKLAINEAVDKMIRMGFAFMPGMLTQEATKGDLSLLNTIGSAVDQALSELLFANFQLAKTVLEYPGQAQLKAFLEGKIKDLAKEKAPLEQKEYTITVLNNILITPVTNIVTQIINQEKEKKEELDQKLMTHILNAFGDHIKIINHAEAIAKTRGAGEDKNKAREGVIKQQNFTHAEFVAAAGDKLHPALPTKAVNFEETINAILARVGKQYENKKPELKKALIDLSKENIREGETLSTELIENTIISVLNPENSLETTRLRTHLHTTIGTEKPLKQLMLEEIKAPNLQRVEKFYGPQSKALLRLLFPNKSKDLTFVPEGIRDQTWKLLKTNLLPSVLPIITETIFSESTINNLILSTLESTAKMLEAGPKSASTIASVDEQGKLKPKTDPEPIVLGPLDKAAANVVKQLLERLELPSLAKKQIIGPDGEVSENFKQMVGAVLRQQLNGEFLQNTLKTAFESIAGLDPDAFKERGPKRTKEEEALYQQTVVEPKIREAAKKAALNSISYGINSAWQAAQKKWDDAIKQALGDVGLTLKQGLDKVFRFIFFTVIGNILGFIFKPMLKPLILHILSIEKNVDALLTPFRYSPEDQSELASHVVYNENLVYNLVEGLQEVFLETFKKPVAAVVEDVPDQSRAVNRRQDETHA